jgi:hypothetical protein
MTLLVRTDHATYCPYKGGCAYFSIPLGGERSINAVWRRIVSFANSDDWWDREIAESARQPSGRSS